MDVVKKEMTNLKVLLNNIVPAGICDEICDYNLHCSKCKDLNDRERRYIDSIIILTILMIKTDKS